MKAIKLQKSNISSGEWDEFVKSSDNGTIFHQQKFLSYHPEGRFQDSSLVFLQDDSIFSVFPAAIIERDGKRILNSHGGASYGGFVHSAELNLKESFELVESLIAFAKKEKVNRIQITVPPIIYQGRYSHYLEFAFVKHNFTYLKRELTSAVSLNMNEEAILPSFRSEARTAVKKAFAKGVEVVETERFADYYEILKKNLKMRHGVTPTHTLDELMKLKQMFPAKIRLWGAFLDDKLLAGVCNFSANKNVVLAFYISHDESYQQYRPVNALFYEIMKKSIAEGFKYLDFGIFTVNMDPNWGLGRFKENFGARGIFRDTYILDI